MKYTLLDIWQQFWDMEGSVKIDRSVIYKGLKIVNEDGNVFMLATDVDLYRDVSDEVYDAFKSKGIKHGMKIYKQWIQKN